jgi:hypothetical protein
LGTSGEDDIFTRFQGNGLGVEVALTPIEGLYIAAAVNAGEFPNNTIEAKDVYKKIQVGIGYEIADIGLARAQFKGGDGTVDFTDVDDGLPTADAPRAEIAFNLTAVENLSVDLGAKIWFPVTKEVVVTKETPAPTGFEDWLEPILTTAVKDLENDGSYTNPFGLSLGAQYVLDDFTIWGRVDAKIGTKFTAKDITIKDGFYLNAHLKPSYNLGFATIGADVGFQLNPKITAEIGGNSKTQDEGGVEFGLGAWIQKGLGNGSIKTGVGVKLPTVAHKAPDVDGTKENLVLTIPVIVEYWF